MAKYADIPEASADGLIHFWAMEETSGTDVADVVGGWDAECVSVGGLTPAEFDATAVATPAGHGRDLSANWDGTFAGRTRMAAIKVVGPSPSGSLLEITLRMRYYHRTTANDTHSGMSLTLFRFARGQSNPLVIEVSGGSFFCDAGGQLIGLADPFSNGQWYDIILSGDSTSLDLYINGTLEGTTSGSSTFDLYDSSSDKSIIGANDSDGGGDYLDNTVIDGIIQDLAIWDRKLTSQELSDLDTDGNSAPLITNAVPATYNLALDATLPIYADFAIQANPLEIYIDSTFPISVSISAFQDWLSKIPPLELQEVYRLIVTGYWDGLPDLYIGGISSWQATSQVGGRSSYLQAVIPDADKYLSDIDARSSGELVIQKGYRLSDGTVRYEDIVRARFDSLRPDRGSRALTITVSGYMPGVTSNGSRTLTGVRSISTTNGKRRVRCDVNLFLKPGMSVTALSDTFSADYINYYVSSADKFCEVGQS